MWMCVGSAGQICTSRDPAHRPYRRAADRHQMSAHRLRGAVGIALGQGLDDCRMFRRTAFDDTRRFRGDPPVVHAQTIKPLGGRFQEGVAGQIHESLVKLQIEDAKADGIACQSEAPPEAWGATRRARHR